MILFSLVSCCLYCTSATAQVVVGVESTVEEGNAQRKHCLALPYRMENKHGAGRTWPRLPYSVKDCLCYTCSQDSHSSIYGSLGAVERMLETVAVVRTVHS